MKEFNKSYSELHNAEEKTNLDELNITKQYIQVAKGHSSNTL